MFCVRYIRIVLDLVSVCLFFSWIVGIVLVGLMCR